MTYSHHFKNIFEYEDVGEKVFNKLTKKVIKKIPDYGTIQDFDGKTIDTYANGKKRQAEVCIFLSFSLVLCFSFSFVRVEVGSRRNRESLRDSLESPRF
jgi:hypothetical protein